MLCVCHRGFMSSIEVIFWGLKGEPGAGWCTVLYTSLLSPPLLSQPSLYPSSPPLPSPLKTCKFIRPNVALAFFLLLCHTLLSLSLTLTACINLTNTISAIHSGWAPQTMLISKWTQCMLRLPSHLSEVHAAQPQKKEKITSLVSPPPPYHPHPFALVLFYVLFGFCCETSMRNFATCVYIMYMCVLPFWGGRRYERETRETQQSGDMSDKRRGETE